MRRVGRADRLLDRGPARRCSPRHVARSAEPDRLAAAAPRLPVPAGPPPVRDRRPARPRHARSSRPSSASSSRTARRPPVNELVLHVYPRYRVRDEDKAVLSKTLEVLRLSPDEAMDPDGRRLSVSAVKVGSQAVGVRVRPEGRHDHGRAARASRSRPGSRSSAEIAFALELPDYWGRWGHHNGVTYLLNWYPGPRPPRRPGLGADAVRPLAPALAPGGGALHGPVRPARAGRSWRRRGGSSAASRRGRGGRRSRSSRARRGTSRSSARTGSRPTSGGRARRSSGSSPSPRTTPTPRRCSTSPARSSRSTSAGSGPTSTTSSRSRRRTSAGTATSARGSS